MCGVRGSDPYLAVQLLVQLADALSQLGQLLCDDSMVDRLSGVRLHVKVLRHKITVALWGGKTRNTHTDMTESVAAHNKTKTTHLGFICTFSCCLFRIMWVLEQQSLGTLPQ